MDFPVGWATFFLAIATTSLAVFAYSTSRDTKKQAESMVGQLAALREQNRILGDQFEASVRPAFKIFIATIPTPTGTSTTQLDVIVKNIGGGMAKDVRVDVKTSEGSSIGYSIAPVLQVDADLRYRIFYNPIQTQLWRVSLTGVKDRLDRRQTDIIDFEVKYPP